MNILKISIQAVLTIPVLLAACSAASSEGMPNADSPASDNGGLIGDGGPRGESAVSAASAQSASPSALKAAAESAPKSNTAEVVRVPEDVLRTPEELMPLMQQVRAQIVNKTRGIPEARYEQIVRPDVAQQLRAAGFADQDVDEILADVDYSRRVQRIH